MTHPCDASVSLLPSCSVGACKRPDGCSVFALCKVSRCNCMQFLVLFTGCEPCSSSEGRWGLSETKHMQDDKARWQSLGSASLQSNYIADSVIGSLPRGLSIDERQKISQSIPQSPMMSIVSSMPLVCLQACHCVIHLGPRQYHSSACPADFACTHCCYAISMLCVYCMH